MVVDHRTQRLASVRIAINNIVAPFEFFISSPTQALNGLQNDVHKYHVLIADNNALRLEVQTLQAQQLALQTLQVDNDHLRAVLGLAQKVPGKVSIAGVLPLDLDLNQKQIMISKGSHEGIVKGSTVFDHAGILGQVISVDALTSQVMLLTDTQSAIPVEDARSHFKGLALGTGKDHVLSMNNLPPTADIKVGDVFESSSLGGRFLPHYPVGIVTDVVNTQQALTVTIRPTSQMNSDQYVAVINAQSLPGVKHD